MRLLFDIESTGLDPEKCRTVHCVAIANLDTGEVQGYGPDKVVDALELLGQATVLAGQNIVEYDLPVLAHLHGFQTTAKILDTKLMSRVVYPGGELRAQDFHMRRVTEASGGALESMPKNLIGIHSLAAWGWRLSEHKAGYTGGFDEFSQEMLDYCVQDVRVNEKLLAHLMAKGTPAEAFYVEAEVGKILRRQRLHGVAFNEPAAIEFLRELVDKREKLTARLRSVIPAWYVPTGKVRPKKARQSRKYKPGEDGYVNVAEGGEYTKMRLVEFNPASGDHIASRLQALFGWKPREFTAEGKPKTSEEILSDLRYPVAQDLVEYQKVKKYLGMLSEGPQAWLQRVRDGRIHGSVNPTGAVTGRMSHVSPNLGQIPSRDPVYGPRCRALFIAGKGRKLVGADAGQLQLRLLAHYLSRYDGGRFAQTFEDSDPHDYMKEGTGLILRESQKTWSYAKIFGAGNRKLGLIVIADRQRALELGEWDGQVPPLSRAPQLGAASQRNLARYLTGMQHLERGLRKATNRGWLRGLDGRRIPVLSAHRALMALLQGGEAVVMKHALIHADARLMEEGIEDYEFVLNVHDEWQVETNPEQAELVGKVLASAITEAGSTLNLRCPLDAKFKVGDSWQETH